jgi:predicted metal-dependent phosphoesterase TrpH
MAVDLHTHSRISDGSEPPRRIVELAVARRLAGVALTDHDTLEGLPEAMAAASGAGLPFVPGAELSVEWPGGAMHLLTYLITPGPGPLQDRLAELQASRKERTPKMVAALQGLGFDISVAEVEAEAGEGVVGRPHMAQVLVDKGAVDGVAQAFDLYLAKGRPAYVERLRLDAAEAVRLTHKSGGLAVVAHPHTVADDAEGFESAFERFVDLGMDGVECYYGEYPPETRTRLAAMADHLGLIATGGSDYHGTYKPGLELGVGRGDLSVPDEALTALESARR